MDVRKLGPSRNASLAIFLAAVALLRPSLNGQEPLTIDVLAGSRALWPREVTVNVAHQVPLLVNGKVSGSMQSSAGRVYPVVSVEPGGVAVNAMGSSLTFPPGDTDILARAEIVRARLEALAAARAAATPQLTRSPSPAVSSPTPPSPTNKVADRLNGKLVIYNGRSMEPFEASALKEKAYLALYFSASWCGPCKKFTPKLVEWYNQQKAHLDKFEVIFVSQDKSKEDMVEYIKQDGMPWPAVKFVNIKSSPLEKYAGRGIPCLVLLDRDGKVVSHTYNGDEYVGPSRVMKDLQGLLLAE